MEPPSAKPVWMVPTLAQVAPLAKDSLISKRKVAIGSIARRQNAAMPSWPWWPRPSGSNIEGPTGSSSTASSAYTPCHSSRSPLATAE